MPVPANEAWLSADQTVIQLCTLCAFMEVNALVMDPSTQLIYPLQ